MKKLILYSVCFLIAMFIGLSSAKAFDSVNIAHSPPKAEKSFKVCDTATVTTFNADNYVVNFRTEVISQNTTPVSDMRHKTKSLNQHQVRVEPQVTKTSPDYDQTKPEQAANITSQKQKLQPIPIQRE